MPAVSRRHRCTLSVLSSCRSRRGRRGPRRSRLAWLIVSTMLTSPTMLAQDASDAPSTSGSEAAVRPTPSQPVVGGTPVLLTSPNASPLERPMGEAASAAETAAASTHSTTDVPGDAESAVSSGSAIDAGPLLRIADRGATAPALRPPATGSSAAAAADPPSISSLPRLPKSSARLVNPSAPMHVDDRSPGAVVQPQLGARPTMTDPGGIVSADTPSPPVATLGPTPSPLAAEAPDAEIARRPWLLDKVFGDKSDEVERMNPPLPPSDPGIPPSMRELAPQRSRGLPTTESPTKLRSMADAADSGASVSRGWVSANRSPLQPIDNSPPLRSVPEIRGDAASAPRSGHATSAAPAQEPVPRTSPRSDSPRSDSPGGTKPLPPLPLRDAPVQKEVSIDKTEPDGQKNLGVEDEEHSDPESLTIEEPTALPPNRVAEGDSAPVPVKIEKRRVEISATGPDQELMAELEPLPAPAVAPKKLPVRTDRDSSRDADAAKESTQTPAQGFVGDNREPRGVPEPDGSSSVANERPPVALDYVGMPKSAIRMTRNVQRMQYSIRSVLTHGFNRPEVADRRSNWGMMHSMMVYGADTQVIVGRKRYSTIAWIAGNNACRGQRIFDLDEHGIFVRSGAGLQGHQGQLLTMFALAGVPQNYPIYCNGQRFSVADIVEREMDDCVSGNELTFTLIALSHYLDSDEVWRSRDGETWSITRLIREELSQPIVGAACGGTHRLMSFAHAIRMRRRQGKPIDGQWRRAEIFTQDFIKYAYGLQNRDGSMGTAWFEGRQDNGDVDRKLQTTGHIVEWLLTVTPDSQLQNPRLVSAVNFLNRSIRETEREDSNIGPRGHALRSLAMYYERVYARGVAWKPTAVATRSASPRRR